jgi:hypothetical protein
MTRPHPILAILLALFLLLTGGAAAVARAESAAAAGQMVICSGGITAHVVVDARGRPLGPLHACPDCLPLPPALLPERAAPMLRLPRRFRLVLPRPRRVLRAAPVHALRARGPPAA